MIYSFFCLYFRAVLHFCNFGDWTCDEAAAHLHLSKIVAWNLVLELNPKSLTLFSIITCLVSMTFVKVNFSPDFRHTSRDYAATFGQRSQKWFWGLEMPPFLGCMASGADGL
jgi:hypothetical protein